MKRLLVSLALLVACAVQREGAAQACTNTYSAPQTLDTLITNAASGDVICLNNGNYGTQTVNGIGGTKSPRVTIRSVNAPLSGTIPGPPGTPPTVTGSGAQMTLDLLGTVNGLTFDGIIFVGSPDFGNSGGAATVKNITIQNSYFNDSCVEVFTDGNNGMNFLFDRDYFWKGEECGVTDNEGRLNVRCISCGHLALTGPVVNITNSRFENPLPAVVGEGQSDGIQIGSYGTVVGPGNLFIGITQDVNPAGDICHCDAIQTFGDSHTTITGNYFYNNGDTWLVYFDGTAGGTGGIEISDNVFDIGPLGVNHGNNIWLCLDTGSSFVHNTVKGLQLVFGCKSGDGPNNALTMQDNILDGVTMYQYDDGGMGACTGGCVFNNNLRNGGSVEQTLTNTILGAPTYTGGASPNEYAEYQLTSASQGYQDGVNPAGSDVGVVFEEGGGGGGGSTVHRFRWRSAWLWPFEIPPLAMLVR